MRNASKPNLIAITEKLDTFTSTDAQTFIQIPVPASKGLLNLPIRSRAFRQWLFYECYQRYDCLPSPQAVATLLTLLEAQANLAHDGAFRGYNVGRRVATNAARDQILLDLSDPLARFVEISPGSWKIAAGRALLQTSRSTRSLPDPVLPDPAATSPLQSLHSVLNIPSRSAWLRCLAWLLAALRPSGPYPFLILQGPPGSGKTFAARLLRSLIDPCGAALTPIPANLNDLYAAVRDNWVLAFDHVSTLAPPIADALCRLSSGLGVAFHETGRRGPEPAQQFHRRPVLLTVTEDFACPAALAGRALIVDFPRLDPASRHTEAHLADTANDAWPAILGSLCTALATALERMPKSDPAPGGRLADTLAWAVAASPALACSEDEMRQAFHPPPPPHPLVEAVRNLLEQRRRWTGTATELLDLLGPALSCATPRVVGHQLRTCMLTFADSGIEVKFRRLHEGVRTIEIRQDSGDANLPKDPEFASPGFFASPQSTQTKELPT